MASEPSCSGKADGRPSFQFYTRDWLAEPGLRICSLAVRGLWIDCLCLMWVSPERGVLLKPNGSIPQADEVARMVSANQAEVKQALSRLQAEGVAATRDDGALYSRRMVRDAKQIASKAQAGRKGGLARAAQAEVKQGSRTHPAPARDRARTPAHASASASASATTKTSSSAREQPVPTDIPLPGDRTAMMMLSAEVTDQQKTAMADLLADVYRDTQGAAVVEAVVKAFNQRVPDGDIAHPIAYARTLVDDIGPRVRREAHRAQDDKAQDAERAQELREREEEKEIQRTDPAAFAQAVTNRSRRAALFNNQHSETVSIETERATAATVLCRTLGIEQPPEGWDSTEGGA